MKIDIKNILKEVGLEESFEYIENSLGDIAEDAELAAPVAINVTLINTGLGLLARGTASTIINFTCSICLKRFKKEFAISFEERFVAQKSRQPIDKPDYVVTEEDTYFTYSNDHEIDLREMIREILILNLPIAPKCDINCRVKNKNITKIIDPRLQVLKNLKAEVSNVNAKEKKNSGKKRSKKSSLESQSA
ncbi:MAG: DUF177 domain-containing protein [Candidatus Margulisbacteria bacterium]|nr:DUF177 domain-containing protein [Candidatus Margulisiibacteriota bacterium]